MYGELKSKSFLIPTLSVALIYVLLINYLMNVNLLKDTFLGTYSFGYRFNLLVSLLGGMWTAMTHLSLVILILTAFLTGANLTLILKRIKLLKSSPGIHLTLGGSILGVIGSGCVACGLPIISLLGLTGSIVYLPLRGSEISIIALALLSISFYFLVVNNYKAACIIGSRGT